MMAMRLERSVPDPSAAIWITSPSVSGPSTQPPSPNSGPLVRSPARRMPVAIFRADRRDPVIYIEDPDCNRMELKGPSVEKD